MRQEDSHLGNLAKEHSYADQRRGLDDRVVTRGRVLGWIGATSTLSFVPWLGMVAQPQKKEEGKESEGQQKSEKSPGQQKSAKPPGQKQSVQQRPSAGQQESQESQQSEEQGNRESPASPEQKEKARDSGGCLGTIVYCLCFLTGLLMLLVWTVGIL